VSFSSAAAVALRLGRVSNLPTVWTNTLVGVMLAGASAFDPRVPALLVAMSLFYVGGMFLNDAFDREFDARSSRPPNTRRPDRASAVFGAGFACWARDCCCWWQPAWYANGTGWRHPFGIGLAAPSCCTTRITRTTH
jgi:4-hydroxybenzoate polyprenyltransferase